MKILKSLYGITALSLLLLSACSGEPPAETTDTSVKVEAQQVQALTVNADTFQPVVEIFGTLQPKTETTLSAQVSATVSQLNVEEGDSVSKGQVLATFSTQDNVLQVNYQNALEAYNNAQASLELTKNSTAKDEENTRIAIEQAEIRLKNAQVSDTKTETSLESQMESSRRGIDIAKTNVEIAETSLANIKENNQKTAQNLAQNSGNVNNNAVVLFHDLILFIDETLGVENENSGNNNGYGAYLSFYEPTFLVESKNQWRLYNTQLKKLESTVEAIADSTGDELQKQEVILEATEEYALTMRVFLQLFEDVLVNSRAGGKLTTQILANLQSQTNGYQNAIESLISNITTVDQQISDFRIQSSQNVTNAELSLISANNQLAQAEQNLLQLQASAQVQQSNTSSQAEDAAKAVESAKNNLENVREKNALQIQSAASQVDNARNQLNQSKIQVDKLTVTSPNHGIILTQNIEDGDTINVGSPLFTIAEIDTLILRGEVAVENANALKKANTGTVEIEDIGTKKASIAKVFPTADPNTRQVTIEIAVPNSNREIPANVFATAFFNLPLETDIVFIPFESLISQSPAQVFVITNEDTVERRELILGRKKDNQVEVTAGLEAGERIVAQKVIGLKSGATVQIRDEELQTRDEEE